MKKYFLFGILALIWANVSANAQDVIVKTDNSTIISKVEEITAESIKYRKWDNLDGPTYVLNVSEVICINFSNGTKESFIKSNPKVEEDKTEAIPQTTSYEDTRLNLQEQLIDKAYVTPYTSYSGNGSTSSENNIDFLRRDDLLKSARGCRVGSIICIVSGGTVMVTGIVVGVLCESLGVTIASATVGAAVCCIGGGILMGKAKRLEGEAYAINMTNIFEMKMGDTNAYASLCSTYNPLTNNSNIGVGIAFRF